MGAGGARSWYPPLPARQVTTYQSLRMGITRLIVNLTESRTDQAGSLGDIPGLVDLLCNHNEAMDGLEEAGNDSSNNNTPEEISLNGYSAPADQAAGNLPQKSVKRSKKGKKRARSPMVDEPPSKRTKRGDPVTTSARIEAYEITHRLEFYYTETKSATNAGSRPIKRLHEALDQASAHLPATPTVPFYLYPLRAMKSSGLTGALYPWSKGASQDGTFLRFPVVGDIYSLKLHEFTPRYHDLIRACVDLRDVGRADILSTLTVYPSPAQSATTTATETDFLDVSNALFMIGIDIHVTFHSLDEPADLTPLVSEAQRRVLYEMFPRFRQEIHQKPTVPKFIANLKPAPPLPSPRLAEYIQSKDLKCELLPFQQRSVFWMLNREGFTISNKGEVIPASSTFALPHLWEQVSTSSGATRFLNRLEGQLRKGEDLEGSDPFKGGILAEEVGCGKTVESIALILLNCPVQRGPWNINWNDLVQIPLHEVKTTLIVTPLSLQKQWIEELAKHAPSLKVVVFDGWKNMTSMMATQATQGSRRTKSAKWSKKKNKKKVRAGSDAEDEEDVMKDVVYDMSAQEEWAHFCQEYDVVITTYPIMTHELSVAKGAVSRPRRDNVEYGERSLPKSPLIMVEFWRVIMDEVQLSGGTNTEEMVSRIPRVNSFAVSGTPARSTVADLLHVLKFLRVPDQIIERRTWKRLLSPAFCEDFNALFDTRLAVRTIKAQVKDEFQLPMQTRYIVPIEFGRVERTIYDDVVEATLSHLHVDERGVAAYSGWQMDLAALRNWLHKLRQACTHPQVGGAGKIERIIGEKGIKSMEEVLETMIESTEDQLVVDRRKKINLCLRHSLLLIMGQETDEILDRQVEKLQLEALESCQKLIAEDKSVVQAHRDTGKHLMEEAMSQKRERARRIAEAGDKSKGKARAVNTESDISSDEYDSGDDDAFGDIDAEKMPVKSKQWKWWLKTERGKTWKQRNTVLSARRRENLMLTHKAQLSLGDTYFRLKESDNETKYYTDAENTRLLLLGVTEKAAIQSIQSLPGELERIAAKDIGFPDESATLDNILMGVPTKPGILTAEIFAEEEEIIDVLNEQAELLFEWKDHVVTLITQKLIEDGQPDDDKTPYERAVEVQQECEAYLNAYQSLLADRREALIAERTALAAVEDRNVKKRKTAAAMRTEVVELKAEKGILKDLDMERRKLTGILKGRALKSIQLKLVEKADRDGRGRKEEIAIAKAEATRLRVLITTQTKQMDRLDKQLAPIRKTFNDRIEYFRQLQAINDSVAPIELKDQTTDEALTICIEEYSAAEKVVNTRQARQRYLNSMFRADEEDDEERSCVLCKCEFEKGVILGCVHHFCEECILLWMSAAKGGHKFCPVCRAPIEKDNIQRIHFGKEVTPEPGLSQDSAEKRRAQGLQKYNILPEETRQKILDMDVVSDKHGSKVMFLVKHLLWLQMEDPGSKAVVFSTWKAGLSIIADAFQRNGIKYTRIDTVGKKANPVHDFEVDPTMQVLLLHGEKDVSGLNVTCACRCMIVEPTVNHSFEIQAIARIDRMGQTRPTEVYCYSVEGTVERNILDLGARQGLSLYTKGNAHLSMDVNRLQREKERVDAPGRSNKSGDFIASGDDMLAIMFPHLYEQSIETMETTAEEDDVQRVLMDSVVEASQTWGGDAQSAPSGSGI